MFTLPKLVASKMTVRELFQRDNLHHTIVGAFAFAFIGAAITTITPDTGSFADPLIVLVSACVGGCMSKAFVL